MKFQKIFSDRGIGIALTIIFLFIIISGKLDFTHSLEMKSYDLRAWLSASDERSPDIELVVITGDDINEIGQWPWPRSHVAKCIDNLHEAGAKVIALDLFLPEPEENAGLKAVKYLKKEFDTLQLAQRENNGLAFYQKMTTVEKDLDNDAKLEQSIKKAGNVVLPFFLKTGSKSPDETAPAFLLKESFKKIINDETSDYDVEWYKKMTPPLRRFAEVAAGMGNNQLFPDQTDGYLRMQRHVFGYLDDIYVPSYAVAITRLFKGLEDDKVILSLSKESGKYIDFEVKPTSRINVPLMEHKKGTLINWKMGPGIAYNQTLFSKVLNKKVRMNIFKDKIVIIGHVTPELETQWVTPVSKQMPGIEVLANTVDNILGQRFYYKPYWTKVVESGTLIFFGLFISFILPGLNTRMSAVTTLLLFLAYGIGGSYLFFSRDIWLEISPPLILLVVGYVFIISKRFLITAKTKEMTEADSNNMIVADVKSYKDVSEGIHELKGTEASTILSGGENVHNDDIGATLVDKHTKPTLGRYEVIDELGRDAMGIVYKGEDPKIHRTVAIKTVRISDFDDSVGDEIKKRFFREAESAGLLTHPNIVTIYDAGEENGLAYIAMEFLQGKDLEKHTKKQNLFPVRVTLSIIAQVADALEFAHSKGVVHRDIKPANIIRIDETGEIKVTDFCIARITSFSRTKTGVIMGTPSYMSPEQVLGNKVDGRTDIFSLGVVFYEMLCGVKPFRGDDMTSLMYTIAREKHPSVKNINPKIPHIIEKVIDKALEKDVNKRYQKAGQMARHLKVILKKIDEAANRKN